MIDLHCHLLPGLDDGSKNMATSLQLARAAVANGVEYALLTPHHMNGVYVNHRSDVITKTQEFQAALQEHNIELTVFAGQEVRINGDLLTAINQHDILFADDGDCYLMLEFPDDDVPAFTADMVYQLQQLSITPVIVHPERNTMIMQHPELLLALLKKGCLSQITASSYVGTFGEKVASFTRQLLAAGQGYVFASDAHALPGRKYEMREAFDQLQQEFGAEMAQRFADNAKAIINGDAVPMNQMQPVNVKRKKLFGLF